MKQVRGEGEEERRRWRLRVWRSWRGSSRQTIRLRRRKERGKVEKKRARRRRRRARRRSPKKALVMLG